MKKLNQDNKFENECTKRINNLLVAEDYKEAKGISENVKDQILNAWNNKDGLLDKNANMMKSHTTSNK